MRAYLAPLLYSLLLLLALPNCCPPPVDYVERTGIRKKRTELKDELIKLLPPEERTLPQAHEEARWLSDTAYKASAAIARYNDSCFPGWAGNWLVNMNWQKRGLCWQYQNDLYRELRRRKLRHFRLGATVRDRGELSEHSCLFIASREGKWPQAWVLDAWMWNGRLKVDAAWELNPRRWEDSSKIKAAEHLFYIFYEQHPYPMEFWSRVRCYDGKYRYWTKEEAKKSEQYHYMYEQMKKGIIERKGATHDY